jgi:hypothetical protein
MPPAARKPSRSIAKRRVNLRNLKPFYGSGYLDAISAIKSIGFAGDYINCWKYVVGGSNKTADMAKRYMRTMQSYQTIRPHSAGKLK